MRNEKRPLRFITLLGSLAFSFSLMLSACGGEEPQPSDQVWTDAIKQTQIDQCARSLDKVYESLNYDSAAKYCGCEIESMMNETPAAGFNFWAPNYRADAARLGIIDACMKNSDIENSVNEDQNVRRSQCEPVYSPFLAEDCWYGRSWD